MHFCGREGSGSNLADMVPPATERGILIGNAPAEPLNASVDPTAVLSGIPAYVVTTALLLPRVFELLTSLPRGHMSA